MKTVYFINSISFLEFYCNALTYNEIDENVKDKKKVFNNKATDNFKYNTLIY